MTSAAKASASASAPAAPFLPNKWHLRKVAGSAAKACWICYKSTTSVLITPDNKDFFYICNGHLTDRGFCTPDAAEVAALKLKKEQDDLAREKAKVIAEFDERRKERLRRKAKTKNKDGDDAEDKDGEKKEKSKKKSKDDDYDGADDEEDKKDEERKRKKLEELEGKKDVDANKNGGDGDEVRVFELARSFYKQRIDRIRNAQQAKRDRERLQNPNTFPNVPTGPPGP